MSTTRLSSRMGLFAVLLAVIALSLFGSLVAADRALLASDRESVQLDARATALLAERELVALTDSLRAFIDATDSAAASDARASPMFSAMWATNPAGRVTRRHTREPFQGADTIILSEVLREDPTAALPWLHVVPPDSAHDAGNLVLVVPMIRDGRRHGIAAGFVPAPSLLATLRDKSLQRGWLTLRSGTTSIAFVRGGVESERGQLVAAAPVIFPGDRLEIEIAHTRSGRAVRTTLWLLALLAIIGLFLGLWRERRQAVSLGTRTAELERLYQEVARSNRMKSEFLANVSHELRTPLNAVVGFVEMLREGVYGELTPRQALPVDRIAASASHLRQLVDRLLDIAKIAAGRLEVHPEPLVLRPFVLNVASEMESLVSERGLTLSIAVGPTLPRIRTDQTHLRQILINLIGNAVKYTPVGDVRVAAKLAGAGATQDGDSVTPDGVAPPDPQRLWVALQVSDTGIGIAHADTERIFDEFEQVNAGARTDSARRGTGLGLAISRRLARLIGGELTVASEVGKGSVFTVWLPVDASEPRAD